MANEWIDCKDILTAFQSTEINKNRPCDASSCSLSLTKNINWIQCESGNHEKEEFWLHGMCEGKKIYQLNNNRFLLLGFLLSIMNFNIFYPSLASYGGPV